MNRKMKRPTLEVWTTLFVVGIWVVMAASIALPHLLH